MIKRNKTKFPVPARDVLIGEGGAGNHPGWFWWSDKFVKQGPALQCLSVSCLSLHPDSFSSPGRLDCLDTIIPRTFSFFPTEALNPLNTSFLFPHPWQPPFFLLTSVSMNSTTQGASSKRNHIFVLCSVRCVMASETHKVPVCDVFFPAFHWQPWEGISKQVCVWKLKLLTTFSEYFLFNDVFGLIAAQVVGW